MPLADVALLAPVIPRSKVVAVGSNYRDHAAELGNEVPAEPMLFFKPNTSVIGPGDAIVLPTQCEQVEHRGRARRRDRPHREERAAEDAPTTTIFGYTIANDVTARDLQKTRRPVGAREGLRHVLPARPRDRDATSTSRPATIETR